MARIRITQEACQRYGKDTAPVASKTYRDWVNKLPCMVSGTWPVEAAHLNTASAFWGHTGRAKRNKASDRWVLPLSQEKHREQHHGGEMEFWARHRINPHLAATILYGLFNERGDDGIERARQMILGGVFARTDFALNSDVLENDRCREG